MTKSRSGTCFNYVTTTLRAPARPTSSSSATHLATNCHLQSTESPLLLNDIDVQHGKGELVTQEGGKCLETVMSSWHTTINGTIKHTLNLSTNWKSVSTMIEANHCPVEITFGPFFSKVCKFCNAECPLYKHCSRNPWDRNPNIASLQ